MTIIIVPTILNTYIRNSTTTFFLLLYSTMTGTCFTCTSLNGHHVEDAWNKWQWHKYDKENQNTAAAATAVAAYTLVQTKKIYLNTFYRLPDDRPEVQFERIVYRLYNTYNYIIRHTTMSLRVCMRIII